MAGSSRRCTRSISRHATCAGLRAFAAPDHVAPRTAVTSASTVGVPPVPTHSRQSGASRSAPAKSSSRSSPSSLATSASPGSARSPRAPAERGGGVGHRRDRMSAVVRRSSGTRACRTSTPRASGSSSGPRSRPRQRAAQPRAARAARAHGRGSRSDRRRRRAPAACRTPRSLRSDAGCRSTDCSAAPTTRRGAIFHAESPSESSRSAAIASRVERRGRRQPPRPERR